MALTLAAVIEAIVAADLAFRGAFHPEGADEVPMLPSGAPAATVVLVGMTGHEQWDAFASSREASDGQPDPLDRWGARRLALLAGTFNARALDPSAGPPWWPFQRWAQRAEPVHPSPLGLLIHPEWGLWHSYRGALAFAEHLALPLPVARAPACQRCTDPPCLRSCPVGAFTAEGFEPQRCATHLRSPLGSACLTHGCQARRACPEGRAHRQGPQQARFHLEAFLRARPA